MKKTLYFFLAAVAISSALGVLVPKALAYSGGVTIAMLICGGLNSIIFEKKHQAIPWLFLAVALPFLYSLSWPPAFDGALWLITLVAAFLEEAGWRGFLFKELEKWGWIKMNIMIGVMWAAWHLPAILTGYYSIVTPLPIGLFLFFINLILLSFLFGWFRQKTGGLLAPVLLHTFHNLATTGNTLWESSVGLTITLFLFCMILQTWKRPKKS